MADRKTPTEEAADLRAAIREAHEAMQGLRDLLREVRALRDEVEETAGKVFTSRMEEQVVAGLTAYRESIDKAIEDATAAVFNRFDTIADTMLGESKSQRRRGEIPLAEHAERIASVRDGS